MQAGDSVRTGRWIGAGILVNFVVGIFTNFKLQADLFAGDGLLVNAAAHPVQVGLVAVFGLVTGLIAVAIASALYAHVGRTQPMLAVAYCILVAVGVAASLLEYVTVQAFRTVSEQYAAAGAPPDLAFQVAQKTLGGLRNGAHYLNVTLGGIGVLTFFALLCRARLVPSALALFGMAAALVQMYAVGRPLFGVPVMLPLLAPLALAYLGTAVWLVVKGFADSRE